MQQKSTYNQENQDNSERTCGTNYLLTEEQLLTLLGGAISIRTIRRWRQTGSGPAFVKLGRAVRYQKSSAIAWIEANRFSSTAEAWVKNI